MAAINDKKKHPQITKKSQQLVVQISDLWILCITCNKGLKQCYDHLKGKL